MTESAKIKSGFFWLTSGAIVQNISKLVVVAWLSRLLSPEAFGVVTIAMSIVGVTELLTQISFGQSLVQLETLTKKHITVAFTFSLVTSLLLYICFILIINPLIAGYFDFADLRSVLNVLALLFPIHCVSQISFAILQREMAFKELAGLESISYLVGYGGVSILLAYFGFGVWSLIYGSLAMAVVYSCLLYNRARFKIGLSFDRTVFNEIFNFGFTYSLIKIFNYGALKGDYFVVGKVLGASDLGIYSRAYALMDSVNSIVGKVLHTVLFPFFSKNKGNTAVQKVALLKILTITFNIVLPASVLLSIYADQVINLLLGSGWDSAIIVFRIIALSMVARVGYKVISSFMLGSGSINQNLIIQFVYFILIIAGSYFGSSLAGVVGASISVTSVLFVIFGVFLYVLIHGQIAVTVSEIFHCCKQGIALAVFVFVLNYSIRYFFLANYYGSLRELIVAGLINLFSLALVFVFLRNLFLSASLFEFGKKRIEK